MNSAECEPSAPSYEYGPFTCSSSDRGGKKAVTAALWQLCVLKGEISSHKVLGILIASVLIYSVDILRNLFLNWLIKNLNVKFLECNIICIFRAIKHQIKYQSMQSKNSSKKYKERLLKCNITSGGLSSGVREGHVV